jgi:3(or 17)beta-hydroxysteroid dehydrogenase
MGRVDGKVAIVTGAASGLGAADARRLVAEGANVVLTDVNAEGGETLASELGDAAKFIRHDVADENNWQEVIAATLAAFGQLDVLVNNAGIVRIGSVEDTDLETWRQIMAVNADGTFLGCKHALPAMKERGGSIINMSSVAGLMAVPPFFAYGASKGAVRALTKSVAVHCKNRGYAIRCNSIHPGGFTTSMVEGLGSDPGIAANGDLLAAVRPEPTLGQPEEMANLVLFLASDESRHINGSELVIDNALTAG